MSKAYLVTGTNLGDRKNNLEKAAVLLENHHCKIMTSSSIYETAAWGKTNQPAFLNQALEIETKLNAKELLGEILEIEKQMGRIRKEKYGPRLIDIDIIFFNNEVYDHHNLKIPHPQMKNRRFVLIPLAEIAAGFEHPVFKKTISQLLNECNDESEVKIFP